VSYRRGTYDRIRGPIGTCTINSGASRSTAERALPQFFPELEPSYEVSLSLGAHEAIRREIRAIAVEFNFQELETGGFLLVDERRHDHVVVVTEPGANSLHSRTSVELDFNRVEEIQRAHPHLILRGCFHSHPSGDHIPSMTDRRAWARGCELTGDYWVGIIVTPERSVWEKPQLFGWITTSAFCEPLRIKER
jgi:proteasome lid subunit RPN8/RPN11